MKLRIKTIAMFVVTTVCFVAVLHTLSYTILLDSYGQLERKDVTETVQRVQGALNNQYSVLNGKLGDWAVWDDSYQFVKDNNSAFRQANMVPSSFVNIGVNFIIFVNSSGNYVDGMGFDLVRMNQMPVPQSLLTLITTNTQIRGFQSANASLVGIVLLPEGPLLLASRPILTSLGQGPIRGTLIFARYIDQQYIQSLSRTLNLSLNLTLFKSWQESSTSTPLSSSSPSSIYIHPLNAAYTVGYDVLVDINQQPALVLGATVSRDAFNQGLDTLKYIDLSLVASCVLFSSAMLVFMESLVLSRLNKLDAAVGNLSGQEDPTTKLSISGNDEITSLSRSINKMLEEIEQKTVQLRKSERFSTIGELATMVAHDLRNPLQGIANAAFYLKRSPSVGAKEKEMLTLIQDDVKYSDKIVNDLLDYSRSTRLDLTETNPQLLVRQTLSMTVVPKNVVVRDETDSKPTLRLDADKIKRVFVNLINNAVEAMPDGGSLLIQSRQTTEHTVDVIFTDSGQGMTREVLEKTFTPLFTTKARGMGFGLSICKRIIEAHGGKISVESTVGQGTVFTISLPLDVDSKGGENDN